MDQPVSGPVILRRLDLRDGGPASDLAAWRGLCERSAGLDGDADADAAAIVAEVKTGGDEALVRLTERFEGRTVTPAEFELTNEQRTAAAARVAPAVRGALTLAADRIRGFSRTQVPTSTTLDDRDDHLQTRLAPLRRVAVYAPGGTAAYPSSVLMAGIPAKVAGVPEVILLTPQAADVVVLAAELAGIDRIFQLGGAQAIAAAAFGTPTIPRVDKIVGPGNAYVTAAKRRVFGMVDIDGIAGPSEILILADRSAKPDLVAADLLSQAEHDVLACAVVVTNSPDLADDIDAELTRQIADLPRRAIAQAALDGHGAAVLVDDTAAMIQAANAYAPEHLELLIAHAADFAAAIVTAGAIFVGPNTPEAAGDYTAGPSHVLPTAGAARFGSPLCVWHFMKATSVIELSAAGLREQAAAIVTLARAEGLEGHARAVERRDRSR